MRDLAAPVTWNQIAAIESSNSKKARLKIDNLFLSDHLKETADIMAGYTTGRLFVENGTVGIQSSNGEEFYLGEGDHIEVRNGDFFQQITSREALTAKTVENWPIYAVLYVRVMLGAQIPFRNTQGKKL
ncbi:hypothetical protein [Brevibacillus choshinensis]|uniref:hypothetical protein n=1 Tax=Brevibacillus choshinensis TaxID=54911 RepID=UPI002E1BC22A|nr:hypothetical protein [Brevibacillus choshinensis]